MIKPSIYILTGPYYDDVSYYGLSQLRSYKGDPEDVSFLKELMSRYPNLLPHEE